VLFHPRAAYLFLLKHFAAEIGAAVEEFYTGAQLHSAPINTALVMEVQ